MTIVKPTLSSASQVLLIMMMMMMMMMMIGKVLKIKMMIIRERFIKIKEENKLTNY